MRTPLSRKAKISVNYCDHEVCYLMIACSGTLLQDHRMSLSETGPAGTILMYSHRQGLQSIRAHLECLQTRATGEAPAHLLLWLSRSLQ